MKDLSVIARIYLRNCSYPYLTLRQITLLGAIADEPGPLSTGHLARILDVQKPIVTRSMRTFEKLGLVAQERDGCDGRRRIITLTAKGQAVRASFRVKGPE